MGPTTVIVVNHPGGMVNFALFPAERGLRVGRDILRCLTQIGAIPPNESKITRGLCELKESSSCGGSLILVFLSISQDFWDSENV